MVVIKQQTDLVYQTGWCLEGSMYIYYPGDIYLL